MLNFENINKKCSLSDAPGISSLAKNREGATGNPNVYHSIEDLKMEHFYEELKEAKGAG